jgi:hypothetical protein
VAPPRRLQPHPAQQQQQQQRRQEQQPQHGEVGPSSTCAGEWAGGLHKHGCAPLHIPPAPDASDLRVSSILCIPWHRALSAGAP